MNKVQRNAKAYTRLIDIEYIFYLGYKGKCKKIILRFPIENFQHLEGIGQLKDLVFHQSKGNDDEYYYPRSFVVAPELNYRQGQYKYTVLWKEKRNRKTGTREVLWRFKGFSPEKAAS